MIAMNPLDQICDEIDATIARLLDLRLEVVEVRQQQRRAAAGRDKARQAEDRELAQLRRYRDEVERRVADGERLTGKTLAEARQIAMAEGISCGAFTNTNGREVVQ